MVWGELHGLTAELILIVGGALSRLRTEGILI